MRVSSLLFFGVVSGGLCWVGARGLGPLPPMGPLLDPAGGALALARTTELPRSWSGKIPGLSAPVTVTYDDRAVPHIKATTVDDAYRALGFVVAHDRLFQMELQVRAAAGTVSEFNEKAIAIDTVARQIGMGWGAERRFALLKPGSAAMQSLDAYASGVNAYIDQMGPADLPIEYRLINKRPMRWQAKNAFYFLARMNQTLSFAVTELNVLRAQLLVGKDAAEALYGPNASIQEPIQPNGQTAPRFDLTPLPPPGAPDSSALSATKLVALATSAFGAFAATDETTRQASNNWAIAPSRTKAGYALLSGDPHLELSLPSIWYETHLTVPGQFDTYGFTFAGTPSIVLGLNRDVAWSATNTGADVVDFYRETVDDPSRPTKYMLDGTWRPLELHEEVYRSPSGSVLRTDTMRYTHRGPMRRVADTWLSMRWTALDTNNVEASLGAFQAAQRATSVSSLMDAMAAYPGPAQNFVMADRGGNIGIRSTGLYPVRPGNGSGLLFRDGSVSASDWTGYWPVKDYPQAINPAQGYLASANQQPVDPKVRPAYFGADWPAPWRAMRINQRLRAEAAWTPTTVRQMQVDSGSARADFYVPQYLEAVARLAGAGRSSPEIARAASALAEWTRSYSPNDRRAILFENAMDRLGPMVWDELSTSDANAAMRPRLPGGMALAKLMQQPDSKWWDDRRTPALETRDDVLARALTLAYAEVSARHGRDSSSDEWRWGNTSPMKIYHLLRLEPFSELEVETRSGPETIAPRASNGTHSASERLIVELGPQVRAWTTYPGGQSGNPFSRFYKNRIPSWSRGKLDTAIFADVPAAKLISTLTLTPGDK